MHLEDITDLDDYFMFPWETANSLKELRDHWQDLRNQVAGRGLAPRTDMPKDLQGRILLDYKAFRRWENEIGFLDRWSGVFQDELAHYSEILNKNWNLFNIWLHKKNEALAKKGIPVELAPSRPPVVTIDEIPTGKIAVSLGSVAVIASIAVGLYLFWPVIMKKRRKNP